jgi:hypothetical protein
MPGTALDNARRIAATRLDHAIVAAERTHCVYCGTATIPRLYRSGRTRHLDHFVPVEIVIRARAVYPRRRFPNWLLPCCQRCNNLAGQYFFTIFESKFSYLQWKLGSSIVIEPSLAALRLPEALTAIVRPIAEYRTGDYLILAPVRLDSGDWSIAQELAEKALVLQCSSQIPRSAPSKTAFSFSQAM